MIGTFRINLNYVLLYKGYRGHLQTGRFRMNLTVVHRQHASGVRCIVSLLVAALASAAVTSAGVTIFVETEWAIIHAGLRKIDLSQININSSRLFCTKPNYSVYKRTKNPNKIIRDFASTRYTLRFTNKY